MHNTWDWTKAGTLWMHTGFYFQALQSAAFVACLHQWWRRYLRPLSADSAAVVKKRRLHWRRISQHAPTSSTQMRSVKSAYRKCSTRLAYNKNKRASMLCSYQHGFTASRSRVSARVNTTQCLPSCHSLLLQGASSEPIVKGNGTAAGSCCNMSVHFDTPHKRNTLKQNLVSLFKKKGMCFQCCDALFSWKYSFTFSLNTVFSFQSVCVAHLAKVSYYTLLILQKISFSSHSATAVSFSPIKWSGN